MKILIFSSLTIVGLLLVGLQHQQLRELRAENASLQQASAEANRLKADLDKSSSDEAQDEAEIARLREENHDLLKLRNEVNQLRDARVQFEKVSVENQRLVSLAKSTPKSQTKENVMHPITIQVNMLFNRGQATPEDAIQTFYWAVRERNSDALQHSVTPRSWSQFQEYANGWERKNFDNYVSVDIVARREVTATTVQLGVQLNRENNPDLVSNVAHQKLVITLILQDGEWHVDATSR